jgi:hypothetical protein
MVNQQETNFWILRDFTRNKKINFFLKRKSNLFGKPKGDLIQN